MISSCFPDSSVGKESFCKAGDPGLIPGSGRSAWEGIGYPLQYSWASLVAQLGKESTCQFRRHKRLKYDPWVGKIPWRRAWQPIPVSLPRESHGQRSLAATVRGVTESQTRLIEHAMRWVRGKSLKIGGVYLQRWWILTSCLYKSLSLCEVFCLSNLSIAMCWPHKEVTAAERN